MKIRKRHYYALLLAATNAMVSSFVLIVADERPIVKSLGVLSFLLFIGMCLLETGNLLFLARTFALGIIGYFTLLIKVMLGDDALFSGYERSTQGFEIVVIMYVATSFALLSNQIGFALARPSRGQREASPIGAPRPVTGRPKIRVTYWWIAGVTGVFLTVLSSYMFMRGYGRSILVAGYASEEQGGGRTPVWKRRSVGGGGNILAVRSRDKGTHPALKLQHSRLRGAFYCWSRSAPGRDVDGIVAQVTCCSD